MVNTYCLINCEGDILSISFDKNKITAKALLDDGSGKVFFDIQKFEIIKYLHSDLTLNQLILKSSIKHVEFYDYQTKTKSKINKKLIGPLSCGNSLYNNLPFEIKMPFTKRIELAVRANYIAMDYRKVMEMVKHFFYLNEKLQLLNLTFGEKNSVTERCKKQLNDIRQYLIEMEIPFEYTNEDEIEKLQIKKVCLINECSLEVETILQKELSKVTNIEMNYLVYTLSGIIADLSRSPRYWTLKEKNKYIEKYKDHYYPFKRNIVIDDILK